jgi:AcrR family transcriptional regulator
VTALPVSRLNAGIRPDILANGFYKAEANRTDMPKKLDYKLRREVFLAAAYRTIVKKGLAGATVRAVAREAGFTAGALVHYVKSVDRLLLEAEDYSARAWRPDMEVVEHLPDKLEALRQIIFLSLPSDENRRGHWNFWVGFWERSVRNAAVRKRTRARYVEWLGRLERLIRTAQESGDIDKRIDAAEASRVCVALVDGIGVQTMRSGLPLSPAAQHAMIDKWIITWLKPTRPLTGDVRVRRIPSPASAGLNRRAPRRK